jgi:hypothetical protein
MIGDDWRGRARFPAPLAPLTDGFGISEPIFVDERYERDGVPLADAMLPSTVIVSGLAGVYFEVYGVPAGEPLRIAVSLDRPSQSILSKITNALRITSNSPGGATWEEPAEATEPGRMARHIAIDLADASNGTHHVTVTVQRANGTTSSSSRAFTLERTGG